MSTRFMAILAVAGLLAPFLAEGGEASQEDFYQLVSIPAPEGAVMEVSAIELLPGKKLAVADRRGDIYVVENAYGVPDQEPKFTLFASGLHEPLGLAWKDGWLYATQRPELTRMKDEDGDGRADIFETVNDQWSIKGDYHEYAWGSRHDKDGNIWVALCLTGSSSSQDPYRGWCVRITPEGEMIPTASGLRSPGGIGFDRKGEVFYTDNQGLWNGSSSLKHLKPGSFQGNPNGNIWFDLASPAWERPPDPPFTDDGSRIATERENIPNFVPPAVVLPHGKLGQSPTGIACVEADGKFGPFDGQLMVGEQTFSEVQRIFLEEVNGVYQGAAFPFLKGFKSGNIAVRFDDEAGVLFVGGSDRGWGARGGQRFNLERVDFTGQTPFEIQEMRARPDGFELVFTAPVDPKTAGDPASYGMEAWTYLYRKAYGSPEVDQATPKITGATVAEDGKSVRLVIEGLVKGHVHQLTANGVRSAKGLPVWHPVAYYTLNEIPGS